MKTALPVSVLLFLFALYKGEQMAAFLVFLLTAVWILSVHIANIKRKQTIRELNESLDHILRQGRLAPLHAYKEGELSILATNLEKLLMRLKESSDLQRRTKHFFRTLWQILPISCALRLLPFVYL